MIGEWVASQISVGNLLTLAGLFVSAGWHARRVVDLERAVTGVKAEMAAWKDSIDKEFAAIEVRRDADLLAVATTYQRRDVLAATLQAIERQLTVMNETLRDIQRTPRLIDPRGRE